MYGLKIAVTDQVSFGPVPVLMVVKIILSTVNELGPSRAWYSISTPLVNDS